MEFTQQEMENTINNAITVGYWSIRGLGAPLRMLVMYTGAPLNAVNHDLTEKSEGGWSAKWFTDYKPDLKAKNPLVNLPYIIDGDIIISQTIACFSYLGRKYGVWGSTLQSQIQCEQLLCEIQDLRDKMVHFVYGPHDTAVENATALIQGVTGSNGILQKLELVLANEVEKHGYSGKFLVEDKATAPDFHLWEMLDQYCGLAAYLSLPPPLESFPRLAYFHAQFQLLEANKKYISSKLHQLLPYNNKMACFGATVGKQAWVPGQTYDFADIGGLY